MPGCIKNRRKTRKGGGGNENDREGVPSEYKIASWSRGEKLKGGKDVRE